MTTHTQEQVEEALRWADKGNSCDCGCGVTYEAPPNAKTIAAEVRRLRAVLANEVRVEAQALEYLEAAKDYEKKYRDAAGERDRWITAKDIAEKRAWEAEATLKSWRHRTAGWRVLELESKRWDDERDSLIKAVADHIMVRGELLKRAEEAEHVTEVCCKPALAALADAESLASRYKSAWETVRERILCTIDPACAKHGFKEAMASVEAMDAALSTPAPQAPGEGEEGKPCEGHYNGKGPCFECGLPR